MFVPDFSPSPKRIMAADLLHAGRGIRAIAMELGRTPSTLSREIRRSMHEPSGNYRRGRVVQHSAAPNVVEAASGAARSQPTASCRSSCVNILAKAGAPSRSTNLFALFPGTPRDARRARDSLSHHIRARKPGSGRGSCCVAAQRTDRRPAAALKAAPDRALSRTK